MQEVLEWPGIGPAPDFLAYEILHGLDIVVGRGFDFLDAFCVVERKIVDDAVEQILQHRRERFDFRDFPFVGEGLQPPDLDEHAKAYQAVFRENVAQAVYFVCIAAVGWRQGLECGDFHETETSVDLRAQSANHTRLLQYSRPDFSWPTPGN